MSTLLTPTLLWLMWPTMQHVIISPGQFKCHASVSVATSSHTVSVILLNQQSHPSSHTHRRKPAGLIWHLAGSLSLLLHWGVRGYPLIQRAKQHFVAFQSLGCLAPPRPDRKRESAWRWSLGSQKDLWCGPSFLLGWDKPGSVAPLRLVGCLIETPAPSWAYFYSIFSLSLFSSPLLKPFLHFFNSPFLPFLSISLPLSSSSTVLRCVLACVHDRRKWKKPTRLGFWFGSQYSLAFFLAVFILQRHSCQDGKSSLSLVWQYPCSVYSLF